MAKKKKKSSSIQRIKMAKEFGRARCPLVTNALTLEAYISFVAHLFGRGKLLLLLIYSVEVQSRTSAIPNRMTCYIVAP